MRMLSEPLETLPSGPTTLEGFGLSSGIEEPRHQVAAGERAIDQ